MIRYLSCMALVFGFVAGLPLLRAEDKPAHWAFTPPRRPAIPSVRHEAAVRTPIDRFVAAVLEKHSLSMSPEADRTLLVRRVSFDLTGLPPTPAQMAAFIEDKTSDAYQRMVERFLSSPHYGERWGKYW